jgi:hypothetical protein
MDMAKFLKATANTLVAVNIVKLLVRDMAVEVRGDAAAIRSRAIVAVQHQPYRAAAAATALGLVLGLMLHTLGNVAASADRKKR